MDAIDNQAAKLRCMTNSEIKLPITYRVVSGGGSSAAARHCDAIHPELTNFGRIKVVMPGVAGRHKEAPEAAVRNDDPVLFHGAGGRGGEPGGRQSDGAIPPGKATIRRPAQDLTLMAFGAMVRPAPKLADGLVGQGIDVEVAAPRTVVSLGIETILASVRRIGRLVVVDEARDTCSIASQWAAMAAEQAFESLFALIRRVKVPDCCISYAAILKRTIRPSLERVEAAVRSSLPWRRSV